MKIVLLLFFIVAAKLKNSFIHASADSDENPKSSSILYKAKPKLNNTVDDRSILRYGFQQTRECKDYEKAYTCIRKCLDFGYQIAYADKHCFCRCKHNAVVAKYKPPSFGPTKWKSGAPTTSVPNWVKKFITVKLAHKDQKPLDNAELYADLTVPPKNHEDKTTQNSNTTNSMQDTNNTDITEMALKATDSIDTNNQTIDGTNSTSTVLSAYANATNSKDNSIITSTLINTNVNNTSTNTNNTNINTNSNTNANTNINTNNTLTNTNNTSTNNTNTN